MGTYTTSNAGVQVRPNAWRVTVAGGKSVRIKKVTLTLTSRTYSPVIQVTYGDTPNAVGQLDNFIGSVHCVAGFPISNVFVNYGTKTGKQVSMYASSSLSDTMVLDNGTITVEWEEPAPASATFNVKVCDSVTMIPIAGASVSCSPVVIGESSPKTTDGVGMAMFSVMADVGINYSASKDGYDTSPTLYGKAISEGVVVSKQINLVKYVSPPPSPPPVTAQTGNIEVYAKDISGNLIADARVELNGYVALTPAMLPVRFNSLEAKSYSCTVSKSGYVTKAVTATVVANTTISQSVTLEKSVALTAYYNLTVQVVDSTNHVVSGAEVRLNGETRTTDEAGIAYFYNTAGGSYTIYVTKSSIDTTTKSITLSNSHTETITVSASSAIPTALIDFCNENDIPTVDIPTYPIIANDAVILVCRTIPIIDEDNLLVLLSSRMATDYPDVHILKLKHYDNKLVIFMKGSPIVPLVAIVLISFFLVIITVAIAIDHVITMSKKAEISQDTNDSIAKILADTTLTNTQKEELIKKVLQAQTDLVSPPEGLIGQITILAVAIGTVLVLWKVLPSLTKKERGK